MSRCFPYPPPGYTLSRASNEALIESIKFQKGWENATAEKKKEKRREKHEKKKLKKETTKPKTAEYDLCGGKSWVNSKDGILQKERKDDILQKERKDDTEQLERSSITEEHELAQNNPSYSSDSTQNSNKRKRHTTSDGAHAQGTSTVLDGAAHVQVAASALKGNRAQGNILRIRLPSQKSIKCDISGEQVSTTTTPVRRDIPDKIASRTEQIKTCSTASVAIPPSITQALPSNELIQSQIPLSSHEGDIRSSGGHVSKIFKKKQRLLQKYTDLFENFISPTQQLQSFDAVDQDWLFGPKHQKEPIQLDRTSTVDRQISCSSSSMWPMARYLPEIDIYALPYTIPF